MSTEVEPSALSSKAEFGNKLEAARQSFRRHLGQLFRNTVGRTRHQVLSPHIGDGAKTALLYECARSWSEHALKYLGTLFNDLLQIATEYPEHITAPAAPWGNSITPPQWARNIADKTLQETIRFGSDDSVFHQLLFETVADASTEIATCPSPTVTRQLPEWFQPRYDAMAQELAAFFDRDSRNELADLTERALVNMPRKVRSESIETATSIAQAPRARAVEEFKTRTLSDFEQRAGELFEAELKKCPNYRVSADGLLSIADRLDHSTFIPPLDYLEKSHRKQLAEYNKRIGSTMALTTWRKLADNPQYQSMMRRRLAHAAQNFRRYSYAQSPATTF